MVTLLKSIARNNEKLFNALISDVEYWTKAGINVDRAKKRAIYVQEWKKCQERQNKIKSGVADDSLLELLFQPSSILTIQGFFVDLELDELDLFLKKHPPHAYIKRDARDDGTTFTDLILALKIMYDKNTVSRVFGGSLTPSLSDQREGENYNREFYPDKEYQRRVLEKTRWENDINEASLIIAQIAGNETIREVNHHLEREEGFVYPEELRRGGILPLEEIQAKKSEIVSVSSLIKKPRNKVKSLTMMQTPQASSSSGMGGISPSKGGAQSQPKMMRKFWLIVKDFDEVETVSSQGEYYVVSDVVLMVEPFKLGSLKGEFREKGIDDPHDPAVIFAKAFTKNMDLVCKHYPVFKRIKQMYRAMKMVQWLIKRKIPIDMKMVKDFHQRDVLRGSNSHKKTTTILKSPASSMTEIIKKSARLSTSINSSPEMNPRFASNHFTFTEASMTTVDSSDYFTLGGGSPMKRTMYQMPSFKDIPSPMIPLRKLFNQGSSRNLGGTISLSPAKKGGAKVSSNGSIKTLDTLPSVFFNNGRTSNTFVYAGVLLDIKLEKTRKPQLIQKVEDIEPGSPLKMKKVSSKSNLSGYFPGEQALAFLEDPNLCTMKFPFQDAACAVCENYLRYSEVTYPVNKQYFCRIHHPMTCNYCFGICFEQGINIQKHHYHFNCLRCKHCGELLKEKLIETKGGFIHNHCMGDYLKDLCETNKLNELFNGGPQQQPQQENQDGSRTLVRQRSIMKKIPRVGSVGRFEVNRNADKRVQLMLNLNNSNESLSVTTRE